MELYAFNGDRLRVWRMAADVTFMKVDGGPPKSEGILVGMANGAISKIYIQNPFPVELLKRESAIKIICADTSLSRTKVASVDESNRLIVTNLETQESLFSADGVVSVCFNSEVDDMLAYTTDTSIYVVSGIGMCRCMCMPGG